MTVTKSNDLKGKIKISKSKISKVSKISKPLINLKINLSRSYLFQVPYNKVDHENVSNVSANNCVLQTFTALGLRDPIVSEEDSNIMVKKKAYGMTSREMAKYLSLAFKTQILHEYKSGININHYKTIKNGNASIICLTYSKIDGKKSYGGHAFIIYKENGKIKYYDPPSRINTYSIEKVMDYYGMSDILDTTIFYNKGQTNSFLSNKKIPLTIRSKRSLQVKTSS